MPICVGNGKMRKTDVIHCSGGMGKQSPSTQCFQEGGQQGWQNRSSKMPTRNKDLLLSLPLLVSPYFSCNTVNSMNFFDDY